MNGYDIGQQIAKHRYPLLAALICTAAGIALMPDSAPEQQNKTIASTPINKCKTTNLIQEYQTLFDAKQYWDAAQKIRPCTNSTSDPELGKMLQAAEIKDAAKDINNPDIPNAKKLLVLDQLERHYPEEAQKYKALHTQLQAEDKKARQKMADQEAAYYKSKGVHIGMTKAEVLRSSWGTPTDINRTTTARGTREQWVYGGGNYLYFEDDKLVTIQN